MESDPGLWELGPTATGGLIALVGVTVSGIISLVAQYMINRSRITHEKDLASQAVKLKKSEIIFKNRLDAVAELSLFLKEMEPSSSTPYSDDPEQDFERYPTTQLEADRDRLIAFLRANEPFIPASAASELRRAIEAAHEGSFDLERELSAGKGAFQCFVSSSKANEILMATIQSEAKAE